MSLPPPTSLPPRIEEQELDERLTTLETMARLQQKQRYIEALKKGENLDKPTDFERRSISLQRYKNNVWNKLQLSTLKYKDQS